MSAPASTTTFINQARTKVGTGPWTDWHDSCHGHTDLYIAIECQDRARGALAGLDKGAGEDLGIMGNFLREQGITVEGRILKRTTTITEEVIEDASAMVGK